MIRLRKARPAHGERGSRSKNLARHLTVIITFLCFPGCTIADLPPLPTDTAADSAVSDTAVADTGSQDVGIPEPQDTIAPDPQDVASDAALPEEDSSSLDIAPVDAAEPDMMVVDVETDTSMVDTSDNMDSNGTDDVEVPDDVSIDDTTESVDADVDDTDATNSDV